MRSRQHKHFIKCSIHFMAGSKVANLGSVYFDIVRCQNIYWVIWLSGSHIIFGVKFALLAKLNGEEPCEKWKCERKVSDIFFDREFPLPKNCWYFFRKYQWYFLEHFFLMKKKKVVISFWRMIPSLHFTYCSRFTHSLFYSYACFCLRRVPEGSLKIGFRENNTEQIASVSSVACFIVFSYSLL